jgi:predicted AAA+ superfamily ATPase
MAHVRSRYLKQKLVKMLKFSPIVGVLGHRQVGKTTLISSIAHEYKTLDLLKTLRIAQLDPEAFIESAKKHPFAIDEAQLCPEIFSALKERVRLNKQPGQFILSGSVRFTSKKSIRESLTGRIINLELLPFSLSELQEHEINKAPISLITQDFSQFLGKLTAKAVKKKHEQLIAYGKTGGLPGVCFVRDDEIRANQIESYLETILDRDLRIIYDTKLRYGVLRSLLAYFANKQGEPINLSEASRRIRISIPTIRLLISAFESLFLIRVIPAIGGEKAPIIFLEDQGEATYLKESSDDPHHHWLRILYANIRVPFALTSDLKSQFFQYRSRGGAFIPLAVKTTHGTLGFAISVEKNPNEAVIRSSISFIKKFKGSRVIILTPFAQNECYSKSILITSFAELL